MEYDKDLEYNLTLLSACITKFHLESTVSIVISNNHSTDNTQDLLNKFEESSNFNIKCYNQTTNIGAGPNLAFVIGKADTEFVMLLGDDDYLPETYLPKCLNYIENNSRIGCIIPNYAGILPDKVTTCYVRDGSKEDRLFSAGFEACLENSWRAHQLSGLCFRKADLYERFVELKINNLYPQIFFVASSCLKYDTLYLCSQIVHVTKVPQGQKDWSYGDDGLLCDVFDNYRHLGLSCYKRGKLEWKMLDFQDWRYMMGNSKGKIKFKTLIKLFLSSKMSFSLLHKYKIGNEWFTSQSEFVNSSKENLNLPFGM